MRRATGSALKSQRRDCRPVVHLGRRVYWPRGLVLRLLGASPAQTPPEGAVYPHPHWAPQMPPGDHSCPHHPDAGGHLRHLHVANLSLFFYITAFFDFRQWLIQTSDIFVSCFPTTFLPSCCSSGILELLGSALELLAGMAKSSPLNLLYLADSLNYSRNYPVTNQQRGFYLSHNE